MMTLAPHPFCSLILFPCHRRRFPHCCCSCPRHCRRCPICPYYRRCPPIPESLSSSSPSLFAPLAPTSPLLIFHDSDIVFPVLAFLRLYRFRCRRAFVFLAQTSTLPLSLALSFKPFPAVLVAASPRLRLYFCLLNRSSAYALVFAYADLDLAHTDAFYCL
jgi:hypothetical protein